MIGSKFDFMGRRKVATIMSGLFLLVSTVSLSLSGLNLGLDFTGGSLVEVSSGKEIAPEEVRRYLTGEGLLSIKRDLFKGVKILFISSALD